MLLSAGMQSRVRLGMVTRFLSTSSSSSADNNPKRRALLERIIRVDHAGEFGADRIYAGQMAVLGKTDVGKTIKHMWDQEIEHLRTFEQLIAKQNVRPTVLLPLYSLAGYMLGATTALLGKEAAMACTIAVEETITDHYNNQIRELMDDEPEAHKDLLELISKFRDDEEEHHQVGIKMDGEKAPLFALMKQTIQLGCKSAIWLSERI